MTTNLSTEKPFPLDTDRGHVIKHTVNINDDEDLSCKPKRSKYLNQLSNVNLFFLNYPTNSMESLSVISCSLVLSLIIFIFFSLLFFFFLLLLFLFETFKKQFNLKITEINLLGLLKNLP